VIDLETRIEMLAIELAEIGKIIEELKEKMDEVERQNA
jgi:uncharacterized coiled-coil protein SlyX